MARAKKRSDGRYQVRLTVGKKDGKPIIKSFYSTKSITDARRQRDEWMEKNNFGYDGVPTEKLDGGITLDRWIEKWRASYKGKMSANTQDFYLYKPRPFQNFMRDGVRYGNMPLNAFMPIHITEFLNSLSGKSKSTIRSSKMCIGQIFDAAKANGLIERDVCADLKETAQNLRIKGTYVGHDALSRDMIDLICNNYANHRAGLLIMTMLFAGLRDCEAAGLQWPDVDFKNGVIHIREARDLKHNNEKDTKTEAGVRDIPMFAPLRKALMRERNLTGYVNTKADGTPHTAHSINQALESFRNYLERIINGIPSPEVSQGFRRDIWQKKNPNKTWTALDWTLYDLRVSFCTTLYDANVDLKTAQKLMGHKDAVTTLKIYTKLSEERKKDSTEQMEQFIAKTYTV